MPSVELFRSNPLTDRGDYVQLKGRVHEGMPDMRVTILVAYEAQTLKVVGYGAGLADSNFSIILGALSVGTHDIKVCPVDRSGTPHYQYASAIYDLVVHGYQDGQVTVPPVIAPSA
jgi:hypothetical protein